MKTLPALIAASLLVVSFSAVANSSHETIVTPVAPTKAAAYEQGVSKLSSLKNSSPAQLNSSLGTYYGDIEENTLRIRDGGYVTIQERADINGKIGYVGVVDVEVEYEVHESDN